jgi:hypothetical protein
MTRVPGFSRNLKPIGMLIINKGGVLGFVALNSVPLAKIILLALVAKNEPPISREAFSPNIIPLGLIRNKLATPLAFRIPLISEIELPVTREKIF